jgi:P27 family predicted phage terminase small subunit
MRGRKPHPSWRRRLEGNPGKRAQNDAEPKLPAPAPGFDTPPVELANNPIATEEWQRVAPMLRQGRQITEADRNALIALCVEWSRYVEAIGKVQQSSMLVRTPSGYPMPNPYLSIATKALSGCLKLWPELGLTPSSRSRVKVPDDAPADPFGEFDTPIRLPTAH